MIVARPAGPGGVNRNHPAGRKAALAFVAGGGIGGVDAVTRQVGTIGGSPTVITGQAVGTALKFNGSTHELKWANRSTAVNKNMTLAWIGVYDGGGNATPFISTSDTSNTGWRLGTNTGLAVIKGGIVVLNASFIPTTGRPYFFAVSGNSVGTLNFVQRDLLSGVITTGVVSDSNTPQACDGTIAIAHDSGEFLPCSCAAAMVGYHYMTMDALIDWAQDPWGAWFDRHPVDWSLSLPSAGGSDANVSLTAVSATGAAASFTPNVLFTLGAATSTGAVAGFTPNVLVPLGAVSATGAVQPFVFATDASPTLVAVTATGAAAAFTPNPSGVPGAVSSSGAVAGFALEVDGAFGSASSTGAAGSFAANDNIPFGGVSGTGAAGGGTGDPGGAPGAVSATGVAADFTVSGATQTTAAAVGKVKKRAKRAKLRKHKYTFENGITVIASDEATARAIAGLGGTEARAVDIKANTAAPAPAAPSNPVEKQEAPAPIAPDLEALAAMLHAESEEARLAEEEEFLKELLLTIAIAA